MNKIKNISADIVSKRNYFLTPKRSDRFESFFYLSGWRVCSFKIGNKKAKVKPLYGNGTTKTFSLSELKKDLYITYENAVKAELGRQVLQGKLERKPKNWRATYGLRS